MLTSVTGSLMLLKVFTGSNADLVVCGGAPKNKSVNYKGGVKCVGLHLLRAHDGLT